MKLFDILEGINYTVISGDNLNIDHITIDTRDIKPKSLFICIQGFKVDSHAFLKEAKEKGAVAFIVEKDIQPEQGVTMIKVDNSRCSLAYLAKNFFNNPIENMQIVGITGTNGKTSIAFFIQSILMEYNVTTGLIGTVNTKINNSLINIPFSTSTTPDTIELMKIFNYMSKKGATKVVMEVSSHALQLYKVESVQFLVSVFTNLTQDHLDLHGTMENYRDAKAKLFKQSKNCIINIDDDYGSHMASISVGDVITYSIKKESNIKATDITYSNISTNFNVNVFGEIYNVFLPIPGKFTVYNALGAIGACYAMDIPMQAIIKALKNIQTVPGRIESVPNDHNLNIIVDYAHTPDGLENIIMAVREFTKGHVITIFGCGGDRESEKRPLMGSVATNLSDFCVITSDNPRKEDPQRIIDQIEEGCANKNYIKIIDRYNAISYAIKMLKPQDTLIIAGKGHENYQVFSDETIHFDDKEVVKEILIKF